MSGAHGPQQPTAHKWHPIIVQERTLYTLASWHRARSALHTHLPFCSPLSVSLLYSFKRENIPFLGVQKWVTNWDMSGDYTCTPSPHPSLFWHPLFSLLNNNSREKTTYTIIPPFLGTQEMSDKLRYEWQIILRYYTPIIHELSLERYTTSSPCKAIHLERKTTPHLLSHWTTHLPHRPNHYAYSLT